MKKILSILLLVIPLLSFAQQNDIAKFIVTSSSVNNIDMTETSLNENAYIAFYTENNKICMANVWPNSESQSFGALYGFKEKRLKETSKTYKATILTFNWRYRNTYDNHSGTAKCTLVKIFKENGVSFEITIVPETLEIIKYSGYMEGSIDFEKYY